MYNRCVQAIILLENQHDKICNCLILQLHIYRSNTLTNWWQLTFDDNILIIKEMDTSRRWYFHRILRWGWIQTRIVLTEAEVLEECTICQAGLSIAGNLSALLRTNGNRETAQWFINGNWTTKTALDLLLKSTQYPYEFLVIRSYREKGMYNINLCIFSVYLFWNRTLFCIPTTKVITFLYEKHFPDWCEPKILVNFS